MSAPRQAVNFSVGLLYTSVGAGAAWVASGYGLGTPARMGAGFFPFWLGIALAALGLGAMLRSWSRRQADQRLEPWAWRELAWVLGAIGLFGVLLPSAGLVIATAVLVIVGSRASHEFSWPASLLSAALTSLFCALVFVVGLGLPMPLWPTF